MFCKNCGKEIDEKAVVCVNCGHAVKGEKAPRKKGLVWVLVVVAFICIVGIAVSSGNGDGDAALNNGGTSTGNANGSGSNPTATVPATFAGACPIEVSASISNNIIGVPEVHCNIANMTDKEIAAVQFYFLPKDVYGDDVNSIMTTNKLYTDEVIEPNGSCTRSWQMLDQQIKSGDLYIYSVYFADGTEWGDKDASVSKIKKYGVKITAES